MGIAPIISPTRRHLSGELAQQSQRRSPRPGRRNHIDYRAQGREARNSALLLIGSFVTGAFSRLAIKVARDDLSHQNAVIAALILLCAQAGAASLSDIQVSSLASSRRVRWIFIGEPE